MTICAGKLMGMNSEETNCPEHMALWALLACLRAISDELTEAGSCEAIGALSRQFVGGLQVWQGVLALTR